MDLSDFIRPLAEIKFESKENKLRLQSFLGHWSAGWHFDHPLILNDKLQIHWEKF